MTLPAILALSGTGATWLVHAGAADALFRAGVEPRAYVGTSGGSLVGALLASGWSPEDVLQFAVDTDFGPYVETSKLRLAWRLAMNSGDKLEALFDDLLKGRTFAELHNAGAPDLFITGTDVLTPEAADAPERRLVELFSAYSTPDMKVSRAVRISISLPFVFELVSAFGTLWGDGGINAEPNYPLYLADRINAERYRRREQQLVAMGVKQCNHRIDQGPLNPYARVEYRETRLKRLWITQYAGALVRAMRDDQQNAYVRRRYAARTAFVKVPTFPSLNLTMEDKRLVYAMGRRQTENQIYDGLLKRAAMHEANAAHRPARTDTDEEGDHKDRPYKDRADTQVRPYRNRGSRVRGMPRW